MSADIRYHLVHKLVNQLQYIISCEKELKLKTAFANKNISTKIVTKPFKHPNNNAQIHVLSA